MYGIFAYMWDIYGVNVAKYSSAMEHMGNSYELHFNSSRLPLKAFDPHVS